MTCPTCNGVRSFPDKYHDCPVCYGTGIYQETRVLAAIALANAMWHDVALHDSEVLTTRIRTAIVEYNRLVHEPAES